MLIFRQFSDLASSTYTYLLADSATREAILIDPVFEQAQRDAAILSELGLKLMCTVDTHVHADHVTGAWLLKHRLGSSIAISRASGAEGADRYLEHGDKICFGTRYIEARSTPGHTSGCMTYVLDDESMAFTGDLLMIRGSGRTDFQQGDAHKMYASVHRQLFTLPSNCLLYPAHDYRGLTVTSVDEERRFNPRLGGNIGEADFAGYMNNLNLPHPKQIDVAVPANMKSGRPQDEAKAITTEQHCAPLNYTFAGIYEIQPNAFEENAAALQLIDVREPDEFNGPLGHIAGAKLVPLGSLGAAADLFDRDKPIVTVCRSGARSAQAVVLLQRAGFDQVANLAGGMLRWHAEGHASVGGKP